MEAAAPGRAFRFCRPPKFGSPWRQHGRSRVTRIRFAFAALLAGVSAPAGAVSPAPTEAGNGMVVTSPASRLGGRCRNPESAAATPSMRRSPSATRWRCPPLLRQYRRRRLRHAPPRRRPGHLHQFSREGARRGQRDDVSRRQRASWCPISAFAATRRSRVPGTVLGLDTLLAQIRHHAARR